MSQHATTIEKRDVILWVNIVFIGIATLLLFYYVMMANSIASRNYKIQALRDKISSLTEESSTLMSQKLILEAPAAILEFAKSNHLVEAKNISYIFENKNVARR